ncbi:ABC-type nitrate/sulfonate/bicarbonate transport system permease component [Asanoa ferruginea]|uniref:ABC-type nitrate/sulfonate/bicarbonate transport system permease component n=1 Tax=Asanoa ferruginea TaxID=53367 RepID=A0A3D9ZJ95_9ACTN|nr:ABC transporter permease [Asanoa ferruginea]REF97345.1 ABC-type nitrate/sulfonate/bicarbonate transport system permease component [Asanoa ferruginea]GIF51189.1 nitrate ABC transporter permease [Asanoa ferruginea]
MRILWRVVLAVGLPVVLIAAWWFGSAGSTDFYWPSLSTIVDTFGRTWTWEMFQEQVFPSLWRLLAGYFLAVLLGVALGALIGLNRVVRDLLEPVLEFLRAFPPPVLVPAAILLAGIGDRTKILVIVFGCVWPVLLNTIEGVRARDEVLSDTCRTYRITGLLRLRHLVLRAASPQIVTGARQALPLAIILMVISEMMAANEGLGFTVLQFQRGFQIPEMWSGVLLLGLIGIVLSLLFRLAERSLLGWYHGQRAGQREF